MLLIILLLIYWYLCWGVFNLILVERFHTDFISNSRIVSIYFGLASVITLLLFPAHIRHISLFTVLSAFLLSCLNVLLFKLIDRIKLRPFPVTPMILNILFQQIFLTVLFSVSRENVLIFVSFFVISHSPIFVLKRKLIAKIVIALLPVAGGLLFFYLRIYTAYGFVVSTLIHLSFYLITWTFYEQKNPLGLIDFSFTDKNLTNKYDTEISVVIPTLNEGKYINDCIAALKNQTVQNFDVIVIDRSTDSTPQICRQAGFSVFSQEGPTIASARSEGFSKSHSPFIASTDADSQPNPNWLKTMLEALSRPGVVCVYGPSLFPENSVFYKLLNSLEIAYLWITHKIGRDNLMGMNFGVNRNAYQKIGGFNKGLHTAEDVDLGHRIRKTGKIVFLPNLTVQTSPRRLKGQGMFKFFLHHITNFIKVSVFNTASTDFKPFR